MTLQEELQKYGISLRQDRGRVFYDEGGGFGQSAGGGEIMNPQNLGIDLSTIQENKFGSNTSKSNYGDINKLLINYRDFERNQLASQKAVDDAKAFNLANPPQNIQGPNVPGLGGQPMSPEQQAATSPQARQQAIQNAQNQAQTQGQSQGGTNAVMGGGTQGGAIDPTTGQPIDATLGANPTPSIPVSGKSGSLMMTTPSQPTNAYNGVYKDNAGNVFEMGSNDPVSQADFQRRGLNIDHINRLSDSISDSNPPSGPVPVNPLSPEESQSQFEDDVSRVIKESGLNDFKTERKGVLDRFQELQDKKNDEIIEINSNPWLAESLRQKEVQKIESKYEIRENTLSNLLKYYDSSIDSAMEQVKFLTTGIQEDRNKALDRALKREESEQELIKEFSKQAEKKYGAGIIGEYQYAVEQGYKGSFTEYQNEDVNRKSKVAAAGAPKPLSGESSKILSIAQTMVPEINRLKEIFRGDFKKAVAGYTFGTNRELVRLVDNVADKLGRLRSGGAINADEEARFKRQIASYADIAFGNSDQIITALDGILSEANYVSQGIDPTGVRNVNPQPTTQPVVDLGGLNFKFK